MKVLVKYARGAGFVELKDVPVPKIGPGEVLVKSKGTAIGQEANIYYGRGDVENPPRILGTENCGEIAEVGEGVDDWRPGDRVVSEIYTKQCGKCFACRTGITKHHCPTQRTLGRGADGGLAEYFKTEAKLLHRIPDNLSYTEAVVTEDAAVVAKAIIERFGGEDPPAWVGGVVLVQGAGPIGQLSSQIAKAAGATTVIVAGISRDKKRLALAEKLGADVTVNVEEQSLRKVVDEVTHGQGVDMIVQGLSLGAAPTAVEEALDLIRVDATIIVIGGPTTPVSLSWGKISAKGAWIIGNLGSKWSSWERALNLMSARKIRVGPLVTHRFPLEEWKKAFEAWERDDGRVKVMLAPD